MRVNPLNRIQEFGQSIWLDFIRRGLLESGELKRLIDEDGLRGVTVNPSILEKAIAGSQDYDEAIHSLALEGYSAPEIYEMLAVEDVQMAADLFQDLYRKSDGRHGFGRRSKHLPPPPASQSSASPRASPATTDP